jgi:DNA-binding transcriptional MerR regulator
LGIVDWFKKLGTSKVNENLEVLGQATEDALIRVEQALSLHGTSIDEIKARIESQNFKDGMASAALQALRTTQKERLKRMAQILANGVQDGDLESEGLDDMMRAAVELKESDILLLNKIYESQNPMFGWSNLNPQTWHSGIQDVWRKFVDSHKLDSLLHLSYRSSLSRLQSAGMIQKIEVGHFGVGHEPYALLKEGKKFRERLQQITTEDKK